MSLRMWGQYIIQAPTPSEDPVIVGSLWYDEGTGLLKACTAVSPYVFTTVGGAGGTVTSVALTVPSLLSVSGSPVTTAGTFALTWNAPANRIPYFSALNTLATSAALTFDGTTLQVQSGNQIRVVSSLGTGVGSLNIDDDGVMTLGSVSGVDQSFQLIAANGVTLALPSPVSGGLVYGAGVSATLAYSAAGTSGQIARSGGTGAPTWSTATFPATATTTGAYLRADGTNWVPSTLTLPNAAVLGGAVYSTASALAITAAGTLGQVLTSQGGAAPIWSTPASVTPAALTRVDDTNVTLTLGGTPLTSLLQAVSITVGWASTLAVARGGTGTGTAGIGAFNNITSYTAAGATGTTSTNLVFSTSPTLVTPELGAATGASLTLATTGVTRAHFVPLPFTSATPATSGGSLADGIYGFRLVALDPNGGTSLPGTEITATVSGGGGAGKVTLAWTAASLGMPPTTVRIYGSAVGAEDRYIDVNVGAQSYVWTINTGKTVAALPAVSTAYAYNLGPTNSWLDGTVWMPFGRIKLGTRSNNSVQGEIGTPIGPEYLSLSYETGTLLGPNSGNRQFFLHNNTGMKVISTLPIGWASGTDSLNGFICSLYCDASDVLAQRRSTTAQRYRLYNTFTTVLTSGEWFKQDWITTANQFRFGTVNGTSAGTARVATWDYGGLEASPTAAITVPITSGSIVFGGGLTLPDAGDIVVNATTGTKIGTATTQKLGFWNVTPVVQPAAAAQAALTDSTTGTPGSTLVDSGVVFSQANINNNFATLNALVAAMRTAMVNVGVMKGAA